MTRSGPSPSCAAVIFALSAVTCFIGSMHSQVLIEQLLVSDGLRSRAGECDAPRVEDRDLVRQRKSKLGVLLDQDDGKPRFLKPAQDRATSSTICGASPSDGSSRSSTRGSLM